MSTLDAELYKDGRTPTTAEKRAVYYLMHTNISNIGWYSWKKHLNWCSSKLRARKVAQVSIPNLDIGHADAENIAPSVGFLRSSASWQAEGVRSGRGFCDVLSVDREHSVVTEYGDLLGSCRAVCATIPNSGGLARVSRVWSKMRMTW